MPKNNVPLKNYIYLFIILLITICIVFYLYLWFVEYDSEVKNNSNLSEYLQIINYNEVSNYVVDNNFVCLYVTANKKEIIDFEYELKKIIIENNLTKDILYLNVSYNIEDNGYTIYNSYFTDTPMFITFSGGKMTGYYNISQNDYDLNKIKNYFKSIGMIK